jgi:hypothetical protein
LRHNGLVTQQDPSNVTAVTVPPSRPLIAAERARRYRKRKAAAGRGYSWADAEPGNLLALRHGASCERFVDPLSRDIVETLLQDADCPPHLHLPRYTAALAAWGRAEACCRLIADWLGQQDVREALTASSSTDETEDHVKGRTTRRGAVRQVEGAMAALDRHERRAAGLRSDLGLTPASAARMRLDVAPRFDLALEIAALDGAGSDG